MSGIALHQAGKCFDGRWALRGVDLRVPPGGAVCVMGPSGSGKTTLLRLVLGLEKPDEGSVEAPGRLSAVFQEDRLLEHLTAEGNLRFVAGRRREAEVAGLLSQLGLSGEADKPVSSFSGGMKRRVAIARALVSAYGALLLDEPFKGLDAETRERTAGVILRMNAGRTLLMVTHDPEEARLLGARTVCLPPPAAIPSGRLEAPGTGAPG